MITIEMVLEKDNLDLAMDNIMAKNDSCGIDGIRISEFEKYWSINKQNIIDMIKCGTYIPKTVQEFDIIKPNGRCRTLAKYTTLDRFILRAIEQVINKNIDDKLSNYCFAYRPNMGVSMAVNTAAKYIEQGSSWVAEMDIEQFFDNINLSIMLDILAQIIGESVLMKLIEKYLYIEIEYDFRIRNKNNGLIQGNPLSPIFSNLYLSGFDSELEDKCYKFVRFADNINIYTTNRDDAIAALDDCESILRDKYKLQLNRNKTGVYESIKRHFLGFEFIRDKYTKKILSRKYKHLGRIMYSNWHTSSLQQVGKNYHIINDGILTRQDYSLLFENEEFKQKLPIEMVESINIYSNVILSSGFFEFANQHNLCVNFFDKYGAFVGSLFTARNKVNGKLFLKQSEIYQDNCKRLEYAKKIIIASMHNMRANLRYYKKHRESENIISNILKISNIITEMNQASNIDELMLIEAHGHQIYYECFNDILDNPSFLFVRRSKRPPKDAINSLISFGNVYMYNRIAMEIRKSMLDIRVGFLHATNQRSESLNLDIAEIFKPVIVDRVIFSMINKNMINVDRHFDNINSGIYLNKQGKIIFLEELERKLYTVITINDGVMTYDRVIKNEIKKIKQSIFVNFHDFYA